MNRPRSEKSLAEDEDTNREKACGQTGKSFEVGIEHNGMHARMSFNKIDEPSGAAYWGAREKWEPTQKNSPRGLFGSRRAQTLIELKGRDHRKALERQECSESLIFRPVSVLVLTGSRIQSKAYHARGLAERVIHADGARVPDCLQAGTVAGGYKSSGLTQEKWPAREMREVNEKHEAKKEKNTNDPRHKEYKKRIEKFDRLKAEGAALEPVKFKESGLSHDAWVKSEEAKSATARPHKAWAKKWSAKAESPTREVSLKAGIATDSVIAMPPERLCSRYVGGSV